MNAQNSSLTIPIALLLVLTINAGCKKESAKPEPAKTESINAAPEETPPITPPITPKKVAPNPSVVDVRQQAMDAVYESMVQGDAKAVAQLLDLGADTMDVIKKAVASNNVKAMEIAVTALAKLGADEAGELVLQALKHDSTSVRVGALEAAAAMKLKSAIPQLLVLLADKEADIQATACNVAKTLETTDEESLQALFKALQSNAQVVRISCADAFANLAPKKKWSQALTKLLLNTRPDARIGAIGVLGIWRDDRFFDLLVGRMSDADANARAAAINAVSRHTHKSVVRELATHLEDPDATVRIEAVAGLGRVPNGKVQEVLHRALYDDDAGVRTEAMVQMHRFSADPRCALKVSEFLADSDEGVREATALTLLRLKDPRTFNTMQVHLKKEKSVEVRLRLIAAIAQSNPRKAAPLLIRLLAKAKGREVGVIAKHLTQLSGKELGLKAAAWKDWWKEQTGS